MEQKWTTVIKAKTGYFDFDLKELIQYKDLIWLFVKRNYATRYKQTILGPLWLILNPMITVLLYSFVFGGIAGNYLLTEARHYCFIWQAIAYGLTFPYAYLRHPIHSI